MEKRSDYNGNSAMMTPKDVANNIDGSVLLMIPENEKEKFRKWIHDSGLSNLFTPQMNELIHIGTLIQYLYRAFKTKDINVNTIVK